MAIGEQTHLIHALLQTVNKGRLTHLLSEAVYFSYLSPAAHVYTYVHTHYLIWVTTNTHTHMHAQTQRQIRLS